MIASRRKLARGLVSPRDILLVVLDCPKLQLEHLKHIWSPMHVKIAGLGWFGEPLALSLVQQGYQVSGTTRSVEKKNRLGPLGVTTEILNYPDPLRGLFCDALILNIPPFPEELAWFKSWNLPKTTWVVFISSTSVIPIPESASALLLSEQESWVSSFFNNWTILRFGGLLGNGRHPGKYLSGRKNLPGRLWPVNLIQLEDTIELTSKVLSEGIKSEILNVVSDEHPTREDYYSEYCTRNGLPTPGFDPKDETKGKIVSNSDLKKYYTPKVRL
jgi:nucleoside-diphosphate-sugar epimerase